MLTGSLLAVGPVNLAEWGSICDCDCVQVLYQVGVSCYFIIFDLPDVDVTSVKMLTISSAPVTGLSQL